MQMTRLICSQCNDPSEAVAPYNGSTLLAGTSRGEIIVALHKRCESVWADRHNCRTLVPLKKMRKWNTASRSTNRPGVRRIEPTDIPD
jgi:hypothetical protein